MSYGQFPGITLLNTPNFQVNTFKFFVKINLTSKDVLHRLVHRPPRASMHRPSGTLYPNCGYIPTLMLVGLYCSTEAKTDILVQLLSLAIDGDKGQGEIWTNTDGSDGSDGSDEQAMRLIACGDEKLTPL